VAIFDELGRILAPHAEKLNKTIAIQGQLIHSRLAKIEASVSDLGRADFGDKWNRLRLNLKPAGEEQIEIAVVPQNEVWLIQYIVVDGVTSKNPAFIIEAGNSIIAVIGKEEIANLKTAGDAVALPGEKLVVFARAAGTISGSINIIRKLTPVITANSFAQSGRDSEFEQTESTHNPERDLVESATGQYEEKPAELNQQGLIVPSIMND
jgi:hypothetical protein